MAQSFFVTAKTAENHLGRVYITASDAAASHELGYSVAVDGDTIVAGAIDDELARVVVELDRAVA